MEEEWPCPDTTDQEVYLDKWLEPVYMDSGRTNKNIEAGFWKGLVGSVKSNSERFCVGVWRSGLHNGHPCPPFFSSRERPPAHHPLFFFYGFRIGTPARDGMVEMVHREKKCIDWRTGFIEMWRLFWFLLAVIGRFRMIRSD